MCQTTFDFGLVGTIIALNVFKKVILCISCKEHINRKLAVEYVTALLYASHAFIELANLA
jgi:hypothetical protein